METESKFYDVHETLAMRDADGELPEIYFIASRGRGIGKTFSITKYLFEEVFLRDNRKFVLFCRNKLELGSIAEGMFKSMLDYCYPQYTMSETIQMKGVYSNIYVESGDGDEKKKELCGFCIPIASAPQIKRVSSMFSDADIGFFDEVIPDYKKGTYIADEIDKFLSIVTSVARGGGESRRRFPVICASNCVDIFNPYYKGCGASRQIRSNTKKTKGHGWVFHRVERPQIAEEHAAMGINKAFSHYKSIDFSDNSWINDDGNCILPDPKGLGRAWYYCTLRCGKYSYAVKEYPESRIYYVDYNVDETEKMVFNVLSDNMEPNIPLIKGSLTMQTLKRAFENGIVRFKDNGCKSALMEIFL